MMQYFSNHIDSFQASAYPSLARSYRRSSISSHKLSLCQLFSYALSRMFSANLWPSSYRVGVSYVISTPFLSTRKST